MIPPVIKRVHTNFLNQNFVQNLYISFKKFYLIFFILPNKNISTLSERELFGLHNFTSANIFLKSWRNVSIVEP